MSVADLNIRPVVVPAGVTPRKSAPPRALRRALETVVSWTERARMRRRLLTLDERMLRDIGITHADVHGEAEKPFWRV